jgi:branched-chain amino acid transport system ATP-binding protein
MSVHLREDNSSSVLPVMAQYIGLTAGLSPKIVEQMVDAILAMKREGVSIVVSEQNLHFARLISDRAYIIERGKICFGGTMAELDARPDIRDAHLSL